MAAPTSGPAQAPRPTSSTPAIRRKPPCARAASCARSGCCVLPRTDAATCLRLGLGLLADDAPLLDPSRAAGQLSQVIQLGAADNTPARHLDAIHARRLVHERALDADPVA